VANGQVRGGNRRWREWLHRATHHSADDDRRLVQADEQSRREGEGHPGGGAKTQASLDHVLRRAAAEQAARRGEEA
jgi:hypothetical protein